MTDDMLVAYGIDGDGYRFRFGVRQTGARGKVIVQPPFTKPFSEVFPREQVKETTPRLKDAKDGQWCWVE